MNDSSSVYVATAEMLTSVGANAASTAAAVNAGISGVAESPFVNRQLKSIKMAMVPEKILPTLKPDLQKRNLPARHTRLLQLASIALTQLKLPAQEPLPLFLALPEDLPGMEYQVKGNFIRHLILQSEIELNLEQSRVAKVGRAGGLMAIEAAYEYFQNSGHDYLLIGGVDTYYDHNLLARLDAEDRLLLEGSADGFFPGEGAAFVLLASERVKNNLPFPHIRLAKPGISEEPGHRYSDQAYLGAGLSAAVKQALASVAEPINTLWTSMIYDGFGQKEFGVALTRASDKLSPDLEIHHPVDCLGDMGAAMGCALIGLASLSAGRNSANTRHLLCCSSDMAQRSALHLEVQLGVQ